MTAEFHHQHDKPLLKVAFEPSSQVRRSFGDWHLH